ncbi:MAG TPA: DUF1343 domain-containing protein [Salinivirgaceae bacterium]|nr:DUF1343 domain-containing protein [Salinivirgaceae bacterium]
MVSVGKITTLFSFFYFFTKIVAFSQIISGAEQIDKYINLLTNKNIAIITNHTGLVSGVHIVDTLLSLNIKVEKIFCPEHGFRGVADAGQNIENSKDIKTGIPIVSLYGSKKKPSKDDLKEIDILLFDLQDVGVRYYTYISTLHYVMESAAENQKPLIVLDRPNPNGFYIDGPVLDTSLRSFVGMHPIPIVYGMTIGELSKMINGEKWLKDKNLCYLTVIECLNYTHDCKYELPVPPSPNLPNMASVYLYPSLGFFEGTVISAGRGTQYPFQIYGHPLLNEHTFTFTPESMEGAGSPKFKNIKCYGEDLRNTQIAKGESNEIELSFLVNAFKSLNMPDFFNSYFKFLAGDKSLQKQIEEGVDIKLIKESWKADIEIFKQKREKYLIYK